MRTAITIALIAAALCGGYLILTHCDADEVWYWGARMCVMKCGAAGCV